MNRELRALSSSLATFAIKPNQDVQAARLAVSKVLELMNRGVDVMQLAGNMVKLLASPDLVVKKMACLFISRYGHKIEDLHLLAANTLQKDLTDPNPVIRGLVLKTMFSVPCLMEQGMENLRLALEDRSPYVRRIAVVSYAKMYHHSPAYMKEYDFVDQLYTMLRDPDAVVVVNCLIVLDEVLSSEGGIVINHNIAHHLLSQLPNFHEWELVTVFNFLRKYQPKDEEETLMFLNVLDDYLKHNNAAVVEAAISLFLSLPQVGFSHFVEGVLGGAATKLQQFLTSSFSEMSYAATSFLEKFVRENPSLFYSMYNSFFCKFSDPVCVKVKKLGMIPYLCCEENQDDIVEELHTLCIDTSKEVSNAAISAVVSLCIQMPPLAERNFRFLSQLVKLEKDAVTTAILNRIANIDPNSLSAFQDAIKEILDIAAQCRHALVSQEGKQSFLCLLGEYGIGLKECPYILEDYIDGLDTNAGNQSTEFKLALLTTAVRTFLIRPAEMQEALGRLFVALLEDECPIVKYQANFYHSLLEVDVTLAQTVVLGRGVDWGHGPDLETVCS